MQQVAFGFVGKHFRLRFPGRNQLLEYPFYLYSFLA